LSVCCLTPSECRNHSLYTPEENKVNLHSLGVKQQTLNHSLYTSEENKVNLHSLGVKQQTLNHSLYTSPSEKNFVRK
jgi:hypothetical protein